MHFGKNSPKYFSFMEILGFTLCCFSYHFLLILPSCLDHTHFADRASFIEITHENSDDPKLHCYSEYCLILSKE